MAGTDTLGEGVDSITEAGAASTSFLSSRSMRVIMGVMGGVGMGDSGCDVGVEPAGDESPEGGKQGKKFMSDLDRGEG